MRQEVTESGPPSSLYAVCQRLTAARSKMVLSLPSLSSSSSSSLNSAAALSMNLKASNTVAGSDTSGLLEGDGKETR